MNDLYDALNHIQKAVSLLGEDLVTHHEEFNRLLARSGFIGGAAQAPFCRKQLTIPMINNIITRRIHDRQAAMARSKL